MKARDASASKKNNFQTWGLVFDVPSETPPPVWSKTKLFPILFATFPNYFLIVELIHLVFYSVSFLSGFDWLRRTFDKIVFRFRFL